MCIDSDEENQSTVEDNNDNLEVESDDEDELTTVDDTSDTDNDDLGIIEKNNELRDKLERNESNKTHSN